MVSDFFYPNHGGVESHLYHMSQQLIALGHKIVIVTHAYGNRSGVRYLTNGLKVYYLPSWIMTDQVVLPTICSFLPIMRYIFIRERIDIVHGHQAFSPLAHEGIIHARTMGIRACFTDHSLFGFADVSSILTNKLLKLTLSDVNHVVCVSFTSKENTVLRAALNPRNVSVIPNAIVSNHFIPDPTIPRKDRVTIIVASRFTYLKGADLLVQVIPAVCALRDDVDFVLAGDGPKRIDLEQMREKHVLQDRVRMLGSVRHAQVREVLVQGTIFLNTSRTEAFCIGIVEAASCGLLVVSTKVGGVPEVLPEDIMLFARPHAADLVRAVLVAIDRSKSIDPWELHERVKSMYSWSNVAKRTDRVYRMVMEQEETLLIERFRRYYGCGLWAGKIFVLVIALNYLFVQVLDWLYPRKGIQQCPRFRIKKNRQQ
ncbi:hypothetical protein DFJ74DRAFT_242389 [Hyaloraphidium curvatum]|nr:hypothetical protein DFJ74DRAFT_242389 [Hyaloraphidium curvatum]